MENQQTEFRAAEAILQRGVEIPVRAPLLFRLFGKKFIHPVLRYPFGGTLFRISSYYLSMNITSEQLKAISVEEALRLYNKHHTKIDKIVACALLNSWLLGWLFTRPLALYLRWNMKPYVKCNLVELLVLFGGTNDFMNTTRSARMTMITAPNLGQENQGS